MSDPIGVHLGKAAIFLRALLSLTLMFEELMWCL